MKRNLFAAILISVICFTCACSSQSRAVSLPILPITINFYSKTEMEITDISYSFSQNTLILSFSGEKTKDIYFSTSYVGAKISLYNQNGHIIASDCLEITGLLNGEKFKNQKVYFYNIPQDFTTLTIEITECT